MKRTGTAGTTPGIVTLSGLAAVGAVLLSLTACSGTTAGYGGTPPSPSSSPPAQSPAPSTVSIPPGAAAVAAERVIPPEGMDPATIAVWTTGDGRTVGTYAQEGGCGRSEAKIAGQTDDRVTITLLEITPGPNNKRVCTMDIRYPEVTVTLDAPLGARKVVLQRNQVSEL